MGHDVFISHSSQSSSAATTIVQQLEQNGIRCWIAPRDLDPGSEWAEGIIDGIEECPVFLLILCPHANSSPQVLREVERAVSKKKPIIPVMLGNFTLSKSLEYFISSHHWLEFSPKTARNNTKILIDVIHKKLSNQDRVTSSSPQEAPPNTHNRQAFFARKRAVLPLLALLFLLLSWLFFHFFRHHFESPAPPPTVPKTTTQALDHSPQATISEEDLGPDVVSGEVFGIPNGNVVKARIHGKEIELRLYGTDAPAPQQEYNEDARTFLEKLIIGNRIRATLFGKDDRGHTEALVSSGEALLNKEMVRAGYAWKNPKHCRKEPLCSELGQLQQEARAQGLGLWQGVNPIPPWEWFRYLTDSSAYVSSLPDPTAQPVDQFAQTLLSPTAVEGEVLDVPHGDGLQVRVQGKLMMIRLYGIEAPSRQQQDNLAARRFLKQLILDDQVQLELIGPGRGQDIVALAVSGGKILNKEMVRLGYSRKNHRHCRREPFCSELAQLEEQARSERRGLWQEDNPLPPRD